MENDVANHINYWLELKRSQEDDLSSIRHWSNLKIAFEADLVWIKDLTFDQINSVTVKRIPFVKRYRAEGGKLFPLNSRLPYGNMPSLLWTPMERGLPITLPKFNFNYFGMSEQLKMTLIESANDRKANGMVTTIAHLEAYIIQAPKIRLQGLKWVILDQKEVLLFGHLLLPIPGDAFWQQGNFLIPVGYEFKQHKLINVLNEKINPLGKFYIVWNKTSTFFKIDKLALQPLSISSFRMSKAVENFQQ